MRRSVAATQQLTIAMSAEARCEAALRHGTHRRRSPCGFGLDLAPLGAERGTLCLEIGKSPASRLRSSTRPARAFFWSSIVVSAVLVRPRLTASSIAGRRPRTDIQNPGADGTAQGSKGINGDGTSFFHSHRIGRHFRSPMR